MLERFDDAPLVGAVLLQKRRFRSDIKLVEFEYFRRPRRSLMAFFFFYSHQFRHLHSI